MGEHLNETEGLQGLSEEETPSERVKFYEEAYAQRKGSPYFKNWLLSKKKCGLKRQAYVDERLNAVSRRAKIDPQHKRFRKYIEEFIKDCVFELEEKILKDK